MAELIQGVVEAPVVSDDRNSPEAKLARDAKRIQIQSETDGKFDTVLNRDGTVVRMSTTEGFSNTSPNISLPLVGIVLGFILFLGIAKR